MSENKSKLQGWLMALRPRVFVASYVPMGLGGAIALKDGVFNPLIFLLALVGVMALQTTANLINEYADHQRGADDLKQAGQSLAIKTQLLSPQEIFWGAITSLVLGIGIGLFLLSQSGTALWWIGIGGVLVAITYTAGPFPLAYHGLGEVAAGIFMGPMVVLGAYYVMYAEIPAQKGVELSFIAFPIMFTTAAILHANNIRDLDADRAVNKRTLAVRFGLQVARWEYRNLLILAYASQVVLIVLGLLPVWTILSALTIPEAIRLVRVFNNETETAKLHVAQGQTARLHGQLGLWIIVGIFIEVLMRLLT